MSTEEVKKKTLLTHVTSILFRQKPEAAPVQTAVVAVDPAKLAEQEEKRKKMLDAYAKHCDEGKPAENDPHEH